MGETEREDTCEAGERERRAEAGPTTRLGRRSCVQNCAGVVVRSGMLGVRILGEHDEVACIVGPIAQGMEVEGAPDRGGLGRGLHPGEGIAVSDAPPSLHVDLHLTRILRG